MSMTRRDKIEGSVRELRQNIERGHVPAIAVALNDLCQQIGIDRASAETEVMCWERAADAVAMLDGETLGSETEIHNSAVAEPMIWSVDDYPQFGTLPEQGDGAELAQSDGAELAQGDEAEPERGDDGAP